MNPIDPIIHILSYRNRPDLANSLRDASYQLNVSSSYGTRLFSSLTTAEVYAPIHKHEFLQKLTDEDKAEIIKAFHVVHPVREHDVEIVGIEFLIDPDAPIPQKTRDINRLINIDFLYINEQIQKCDAKLSEADFEGAITNARNLLESICKYVLDQSGSQYNDKADLPDLYKLTAEILNMHPVQHIENSFKQILSGCFSIVQGMAAIRNQLSDAHGKSQTKNYKPDERHAMLVVGVAKSLADFMYASFSDSKDA